MKFTISLKKNHEFRRLYAKGKNAVSPYLALYCKKHGNTQNRVGITVGGKLGHAVIRNRTRRRLREIYRTNEQLFCQGYDLVIVARVRAVGANYQSLERSFLALSKKLGLLKESAQ